MDKEIFEGVMEGLKEALAIARGEAEPVEVIEISENPKAIKKKLNLSQVEFADFEGGERVHP